MPGPRAAEAARTDIFGMITSKDSAFPSSRPEAGEWLRKRRESVPKLLGSQRIRERRRAGFQPLAQVADPRRRRGRRFALAFTLAVAIVCVLAGAGSFREIGDQAADLPQDMLAALGGVPCPLRRKIAVPSKKRIRTLLQDLDGDALDAALRHGFCIVRWHLG